MSRLAALCALALWAGGAAAAELPTRSAKTKPPSEKQRECEIGGERGFALPGGGCVRISGNVSAGVGSSLRH